MARRGIGRAVVERLARDGVTVVFGYAENTAAALEVEKTVDHAGGQARGSQVDLGDPAATRAFLDRALEQLAGLDILVNNAAAPHTPTSFAASPPTPPARAPSSSSPPSRHGSSPPGASR